MSEEFVPTAAEDYPQAVEKEMELPSGARAIVRPVNRYVLLKSGRFPKEVEDALLGAANGGGQPDLKVYLRAMDVLLCEAFVAPKVHQTPKKGYLCVDDLTDADREAVITELGLSAL